LGLILGQSLWHAFFPSAVGTDEKFMQKMDDLTREIGDRGKLKTRTSVAEGVPPSAAQTPDLDPAPAAFEPTPEPAPAPAPAAVPTTTRMAAVPSTPTRSSQATAVATADQQGFSPSMQQIQMSPGMAMMPMHGSMDSSGLVERLLAQQKDMMEQQQANVEQQRQAMEAKMEQQQAKMEQQQAKMEQQRQAMEAKMEQQRKELEGQLEQQRVITKDQLAAVQTRLDVLHASELLSDDELGAVEDCLADFFEASAGCEHMTMETASMNRAVGTVLKLIALSEGMTKDKMFARQVKRKFC
jgi:hypothetical protein